MISDPSPPAFGDSQLDSARQWLGRGAVVGGVILLGLALRLINYTFQPLWWDEGYSVYFAIQDFAGITLKTAADIHPPLYYYLLHTWMALFGASDAVDRLLSVFIGAACVPALYTVVARVSGRRAGLIAALLLAVSPMQVYYSQEVRMYSLATLLGLGSIYFAQRILLPGSGTQAATSSAGSVGMRFTHWLGYLVCTSLAMYTLYFAALIPLFQTVFVVLQTGRRALSRRDFGRWLAGQAALALLFAPWVVTAAPILIDYIRAKMIVEARTPLDPLTYFLDHLTAFSAGHAPVSWIWIASATAGLLVLAAAGAWLYLHRQPSAGAWYLLWLAVPVTGGYFINLIYPFNPTGYQRFLLFAQPAMLALAAASVEWIVTAPKAKVLLRSAGGATALLVAAGMVGALISFYVTPRYAADDYRPLISRIATLSTPADSVLCVFPWQVGYLYTYYPRPLPRIVEAPDARWISDSASMDADLTALLASSRVVWFPAHQRLGAILEKQVESRLARWAYPAANDWSGDTRLYAFSSLGALAEQPAGQSFGGRLQLTGAALGATPVETGAGVLPVELRWRITGSLGPSYSVRLRLADSQGRTWAQRDSAPAAASDPFEQWTPGSDHTDRHALLIPAGTPPGRYSLRLSVYSQKAGDSLTITAADGPTIGPELMLGNVTVIASPFRPPTAALGMGQATTITFGGDEVTLRGFTLPSGNARPGDMIPVSLYWQATSARRAAFVAFIQMQDATGKPWALVETPDLGSGYTLDRMAPGETVHSQYGLLLPATIPDGEYRLAVGLLDPVTRQRLKAGAGDQAVVSAINVKGRTHSSAAPAMQRPVQARFGDMAELLGYDLVAAPGGRSFTVTLAWRVLKETSTSYTVFVHIAADSGTIVGQRDVIPRSGDAPTTSWIPGEVITDTYTVDVKPEAAAGTYRLEIGMYQPATGRRLPVSTPSLAERDALVLETLRVGP